MTEPNHEVERFDAPRVGKRAWPEAMVPSPEGIYVYHSDYEKVEARAEKAEAEVERVRRHEVETAEAALKKVAQAKAQALAEVREGLLSDEAREAFSAALAMMSIERWRETYPEQPREELLHCVGIGLEAAFSTFEDTQGEGDAS